MLKYGIIAKAVELLCFKSALGRLAELRPEMNMRDYRKRVKREYRAMLLRTPDIGGSSLEMNLYIAAFVFSLHKAEPEKITPDIVNEMVTAVFDSPLYTQSRWYAYKPPGVSLCRARGLRQEALRYPR